ncbi:hypothetical protein L2E82_17994 [Cichorium intybus]|uniref:Uncharacterized protein n=1 Tax=Cichorium intybus TaxID=13427 RepID=A0ACB9F945_CICIN|nr:hypothetical protein L2E82_17994 [Cichorium intybus]
MRQGLPLDRPLLRIASAIDLLTSKEGAKWQYFTERYTDVVSYVISAFLFAKILLLDQEFLCLRMYTLGSQVVEFMVELCLWFKGWGCAYRSLQTISCHSYATMANIFEVRIIRLWKSAKNSNSDESPSLDIILMDKQGIF